MASTSAASGSGLAQGVAPTPGMTPTSAAPNPDLPGVPHPTPASPGASHLTPVPPEASIQPRLGLQ
ncbi:hypothetical protein Aple_028410 [Acrocarpospora pleiomorpha]|uniref:Uncharacterized protein n=1 Tax=Acrocarpospora pleiomorpha TaxID=90975 RepID=A0A5M3XEA7_9ACTN|nr:hypothetical protein Aple_028410 [Acrocarpospora pleiomorpha]